MMAIESPKHGTLYRQIVGSLKSSIDAHGPITYDLIPSAGKRILLQILKGPLSQASEVIEENKRLRKILKDNKIKY